MNGLQQDQQTIAVTLMKQFLLHVLIHVILVMSVSIHLPDFALHTETGGLQEVVIGLETGMF